MRGAKENLKVIGWKKIENLGRKNKSSIKKLWLIKKKPLEPQNRNRWEARRAQKRVAIKKSDREKIKAETKNIELDYQKPHLGLKKQPNQKLLKTPKTDHSTPHI